MNKQNKRPKKSFLSTNRPLAKLLKVLAEEINLQNTQAEPNIADKKHNKQTKQKRQTKHTKKVFCPQTAPLQNHYNSLLKKLAKKTKIIDKSNKTDKLNETDKQNTKQKKNQIVIFYPWKMKTACKPREDIK